MEHRSVPLRKLAFRSAWSCGGELSRSWCTVRVFNCSKTLQRGGFSPAQGLVSGHTHCILLTLVSWLVFGSFNTPVWQEKVPLFSHGLMIQSLQTPCRRWKPVMFSFCQRFKAPLMFRAPQFAPRFLVNSFSSGGYRWRSKPTGSPLQRRSKNTGGNFNT